MLLHFDRTVAEGQTLHQLLLAEPAKHHDGPMAISEAADNLAQNRPSGLE